MFDLSSFSCGPLATNAFLLSCMQTKCAVIFDPGQGAAEQLLQKAKEKKVAIEKVLLTHSHWDHLVDLALVVEKLNIPVFVHKADSENVRAPGSDGIPLLFPCQGVQNLSFLEDGKQIKVGQLILDVLHTPGHSPGSVCFYLAEQKVLISGDTLFRGSIGNLSLPTANRKDMWRSLQKLAQLPKDVRVYPGHGEMTTIGAEHWLSRAEEVFGK